MSPAAHKLKLCVRPLHAGMLLNTFPQHTAESLFLWPGSKTRAMEHPLVRGVMNRDASKPLSYPLRADHGCFNVVSSDAHLPSPQLPAGCISPVLYVSSVESTVAFSAPLAVSLVSHFFWIFLLALRPRTLRFMALTFCPGKQAGCAYLGLGWSTSDGQQVASAEMPPELFVLPQP